MEREVNNSFLDNIISFFQPLKILQNLRLDIVVLLSLLRSIPRNVVNHRDFNREYPLLILTHRVFILRLYSRLSGVKESEKSITFVDTFIFLHVVGLTVLGKHSEESRFNLVEVNIHWDLVIRQIVAVKSV